MSVPHIILDNLSSFCQNCQIRWKFDVVIIKGQFHDVTE